MNIYIYIWECSWWLAQRPDRHHHSTGWACRDSNMTAWGRPARFHHPKRRRLAERDPSARQSNDRPSPDALGEAKQETGHTLARRNIREIAKFSARVAKT